MLISALFSWHISQVKLELPIKCQEILTSIQMVHIDLYKICVQIDNCLNWFFYYACVSSEHLSIHVLLCWISSLDEFLQSFLDWIRNLLDDVCFGEFGICFKPIVWLFVRTISSILQIKWNFLILEGDLIVFLTDCLIFLSPFLDVTRIPTSTVSFLAQLISGIFWL